MSPRRDVGRPRVFSDDAIFRATNALIERTGYDSLTLEAIATEVGCTRQALVRRFGSKQALLLAFLDRLLVVRAADYRIVETDAPSPLAALRARKRLMFWSVRLNACASRTPAISSCRPAVTSPVVSRALR